MPTYFHTLQFDPSCVAGPSLISYILTLQKAHTLWMTHIVISSPVSYTSLHGLGQKCSCKGHTPMWGTLCLSDWGTFSLPPCCFTETPMSHKHCVPNSLVGWPFYGSWTGHRHKEFLCDSNTSVSLARGQCSVFGYRQHNI